jgi:xanthine dehydrogenase large subunit
MPEQFNVHLFERATESGVVYGSKAVGEPPLMLAISVREALRQAIAAFGPAGISVELASPATPEAVFWALERAIASSGDNDDDARPPVAASPQVTTSPAKTASPSVTTAAP